MGWDGEASRDVRGVECGTALNVNDPEVPPPHLAGEGWNEGDKSNASN